MSSATKIVCPECSASDGLEQRNEKHRCVYCGTTFTITQARSDEEKLQAAIQSWFKDNFGQAASRSDTVDAVGRTLLFNRYIYPELERDVDNSLSPYQFVNPAGVARLPVPTRRDARDNGTLLLSQRASLNALGLLRRRLASEHVRAFAMDDAMQVRLRRLERRVAQVIWLTNAAHACESLDENTYRAVGANFRALNDELSEGLKDSNLIAAAGEAEWFQKQKEYLAVQARLLAICERLVRDEEIEGRLELEATDEIGQEFDRLIAELEKLAFDPGLAVSFAIAVKRERENLGLLQSWLRAHTALTRGRPRSFRKFQNHIESLIAGFADPGQKAAVLDNASRFVAFVEHGRTTMVIDDFAWAAKWAEGQRERGFFGGGEQVETIDEYFVPVWLAEVKCSRSTGRFLKSGQQDVVHALLNAAASRTGEIHLIGGAPDVFALAEHVRDRKALPHRRVAFPMQLEAAAQAAFERYFARHTEILNARPKVLDLAFVPAVRAVLVSKKGRRSVHCCLNGSLPIDDAVFASLELTQKLSTPSSS